MLSTLNDYYFGQGNPGLCGNEISIADYPGVAFLTPGKVIGNDFSEYANIDRWLDTIKAMPSWAAANNMHYGFVAAMKDKTLARIA